MFDLTAVDLEPIEALARQIDPDLDLTIPAAWGLLFLCCGINAAGHPRRAANVFESLPGAESLMIGYLDDLRGGLAPPELSAIRFACLLKEWVRSSKTRALAVQRMAALPMPSERIRDALLTYFTLAIYLNSIAPLDLEELDELAPLKRCAEALPGGWQALFFGTGLMLGGDADFPWESLFRGVVLASGTLQEPVKELLARFVAGR